MDVNKTTVIGRLTSDPKKEGSGVKLALVSRSERIAIYATGKLADICKTHLKKSGRVYCEAHFEDGLLVLDEIIMLSSARR